MHGLSKAAGQNAPPSLAGMECGWPGCPRKPPPGCSARPVQEADLVVVEVSWRAAASQGQLLAGNLLPLPGVLPCLLSCPAQLNLARAQRAPALLRAAPPPDPVALPLGRPPPILTVHLQRTRGRAV